MQTEIFALCDYSKILEDKLNIFGVFDTLSVKELPLVHPLFFIAGRIRLEYGEIRKFTVKVDITNPSGEKPFEPLIVETNARTNLGDPVYNFSKILTNVRFNKYGRYSITLHVNDKPLRIIPLIISPVMH
ncbi:MAG: hypothetical protein ABI543_05950 [Ignavibacteria bacterium]